MSARVSKVRDRETLSPAIETRTLPGRRMRARTLSGPQKEKPRHLNQVAGFWRRPTLARPVAVLPSGLQRFTSVFGMGTGGATALLSPECGTALAFRCYRSEPGRYLTLGTRAIESIAPT